MRTLRGREERERKKVFGFWSVLFERWPNKFWFGPPTKSMWFYLNRLFSFIQHFKQAVMWSFWGAQVPVNQRYIPPWQVLLTVWTVKQLSLLWSTADKQAQREGWALPSDPRQRSQLRKSKMSSGQGLISPSFSQNHWPAKRQVFLSV